MSMEIDRDQPLSPEARRYLADRNQHDLIALIDEAHPPKESPVLGPNAYADGGAPVTGLEHLSNEELLAELRRRQEAGEDFGDADDADDADDHYEDWTAAELDAELATRTGADGKPLSKSGKVSDKAARLREHDAWLAEQD